MKNTANTNVAHGVGRRKCAIARVWIRQGKGSMEVNGKPFDIYFDTDMNRRIASTPFRVCPEAQSYDVKVNIVGGGVSAQADAVKLGFARALVSHNESLRSLLREHGLLTVDSRVVERKKYGQKKARRRFQFVKR
jgi:small subunit ribosomal protein S9